MSVVLSLFMRMFGRPEGVLGRFGGMVMARTNKACGIWVSDLAQIRAEDSVVEVGFGPGVLLEHLSSVATAGHIAGVDPSREMVEQASVRNAGSIKSGRVDLRRGSVDNLPFADDSFDKALAINSMQVWPEVGAGLREIRRVLKPGAVIALGFTPHSGQSKAGLTETLMVAGFKQAKIVEQDPWYCALAVTP
jgi:ubiquinone/menaquinone biosynthesis C-methylase UbiE